MATISELVVKIVADTAGLDKGINDATKSIDGVGKASKDADGKAAGLSSQFGALKGALVSAGLIAAFVAVGKAIADSVQAFGEAEMAAKRLDAIATMNGLADGSERVQALANELQNLIGVDGDLVVQLGAELIAQGKSVEQTEELIRAANDLSAVTGGDLQTSVKQLTATYSGTSGRLGQLIPEFKDLTEEQLKNGDAIDIINEKYGGMAASLSDSVIPATNRLKEANNDLKETFGKAFAPLWIQIADGIAAALRGILEPLDYMATHSFDRMFQEMAESLFNFKGEATLAEEAQAELNAATIEANRAAISYEAGVKNLKTELDKLTGSTDKLTDAELENARSFLFAQMKKSSSMDQLTQAQKKLDIFDAEIKAREKVRRDKALVDQKARDAEALKDAQQNAADIAAAQQEKEAQTVAYMISAEDAISKAKADAVGDAIILSAQEKDQRIADAEAMSLKMQAAFNTAIVATRDSFVALGEALASGEDAWGAFAKAAVMSIAGIVKALGDELAAKSAVALVEAIAATASIIGAPAAPGLYAKAAILAGGASASWTASGALAGYAGSFARGTDFAPGGLSQVNEEGPEMINLPRGSSVTPATRTPIGGNAGGNTFIINSPVAVTPSVAAQEYTRMVRNLAFEGVL